MYSIIGVLSSPTWIADVFSFKIHKNHVVRNHIVILSIQHHSPTVSQRQDQIMLPLHDQDRTQLFQHQCPPPPRVNVCTKVCSTPKDKHGMMDVTTRVSVMTP